MSQGLWWELGLASKAWEAAGLRPPASFPGQVPSLTPTGSVPCTPPGCAHSFLPADTPHSTSVYSHTARHSIKEETEAQRGATCPKHSKTVGLLAQRLLTFAFLVRRPQFRQRAGSTPEPRITLLAAWWVFPPTPWTSEVFPSQTPRKVALLALML